MEGDKNDESDNSEVPAKKMKTEWSKSYSDKAVQMMKKMGYETDKGLGKQGQGRLEPIVPFQQDGRRGLGLKLNGIDMSLQTDNWDFNCENIELPEKVVWLQNNQDFSYNLTQMTSWLKFGHRKDTLDDETIFCKEEVLKTILELKTALDQINENELRRARSRSNPFETIRNSIFQNRAAVKMANMDSLLNFMFTDPKDNTSKSLIEPDDLLYFADICAGPGGFSEYVLFRRSWEAKGFGFTLRGPNDFKLDKFFAGYPESFDAYYGDQGDGDIYVESNQNSFSNYIRKHSEAGVHFVMADGGFSVEGQENIQEILSKQLYLCQCLTALKILRTKGHFVCKVFDIFTPFSVGLFYLMFHCFEEVSIIKPNSSRPANSERYFVGKWKKENTKDICSYLNSINNTLNENDPSQDVLEIVDLDILLRDEHFTNYIRNSNNEIGFNQIVGLKKIIAFCKNVQLKDTRQSEYRKQCLNLWNLPDTLRQAPENITTDQFIKDILGEWCDDKDMWNASPTELTMEALPKYIESVHDWYFIPISRNETSTNVCTFFSCTSRRKLLRYANKKWEPVENNFGIPPKSFFLGEPVFEHKGEGRTQTRMSALHIIDAALLGGKDIKRSPLNRRLAMCEKFAKSISKPYKDGNAALVRSKPLFKLKDLQTFFGQMRHYALKDNSSRLGIPIKSEDAKFFVPGGILLLCEICHEYFSKISKSQNKLYYFHKTKRESHFITDLPPLIRRGLYASFRNTIVRRLLWKWTNTYQVEEHADKIESGLLYRDDLQNYVNNKVNI